MVVAAALLLAAGCTLKRPRGSYESPPLDDPKVNEDDREGGTVTEEEAGVIVQDGGGDEGGSNDPRQKVTGDYLVRFDSEASARDSQLGIVDTTTETYGVMQVVLQDDKLMAYEWLCSSETSEQLRDPDKGSISTTIAHAAWNAFSRVQRELVVDLDAGTWQTRQADERRRGWRGDQGMPTSPKQQPDLFLDPDGDGEDGLTIDVDVQKKEAGVTIVNQQCTYHTVSYTRSRYVDGTLQGDALGSAEVESESEVYCWDVEGGGLCDESQVNDQPEPDVSVDRIRLLRLEEPLPVTPENPKLCPEDSAFDPLR